MTSPAVGTGIVAFIEARLDEREAWVNEVMEFDRFGREHLYIKTSHVQMLGRSLLATLAKDRAILALHQPEEVTGLCWTCDVTYPCRTVRLLAAIDADHEDYRPEWKPAAT